MSEPGPLSASEWRRLRRIAREALNTYVGRHWPSMEAMRKDGIGHGLVEDSDHERFIRRYLDTFQPEFVLDLLDRLATLDATRKSTGAGLDVADAIRQHTAGAGADLETINLLHDRIGEEPPIERLREHLRAIDAIAERLAAANPPAGERP